MSIAAPKTCYVSMAFGVKPDPESGRPVDHDRIYRELIRPAVEDAGLVCQRADDFAGALVHKDVVRAVLTADVMVADVSFGNGNVMYELGLRHALRRGATVLISAGRLPVNIANLYALQYPLAADGGVESDALGKLREMLRDTVAAKAARPVGDSPLYEYFPELAVQLPPDLAPPEMRPRAAPGDAASQKPRGVDRKGLVARAEREVRGSGESDVQRWLEVLRRWRDLGEWQEVVRMTSEMPADLAALPEVIQAQAMAWSRLGETGRAIDVLEHHAVAADTPEWLGLLASLYKKRYFADRAPADLDAAIEHYRRAFERNPQDLYLGRNLVQLLHHRGDDAARAEVARRLPDLRRLADARVAEGVRDFWLLDSALVLAALDADVEATRSLVGRMHELRPEAWMLDASRTELRGVLERAGDEKQRACLDEAVQGLAPAVDLADAAEEGDDAQF